MWQFLLVFDPELILDSLGEDKFEKMLIRCIDNISQNSIFEIRYYSELFLMRILLKESIFPLITSNIILAFQKGLSSSFGNISRSVSYLVSSGILLQHLL